MDKIKRREPYKLGEIISIVADAVVANGIGKNLNYKDRDFCLYSREHKKVVTAELVFYVDDFPDITYDDEEVYPDFVVNEGLEFYCSGELLEGIIQNVLHQKSQPSMKDFITQLNYYMKNDAFIVL